MVLCDITTLECFVSGNISATINMERTSSEYITMIRTRRQNLWHDDFRMSKLYGRSDSKDTDDFLEHRQSSNDCQQFKFLNARPTLDSFRSFCFGNIQQLTLQCRGLVRVIVTVERVFSTTQSCWIPFGHLNRANCLYPGHFSWLTQHHSCPANIQVRHFRQ